MCSINGAIKIQGTFNEEEWKYFVEICKKAKSRGRDSFGYKVFDENGVMINSYQNTCSVDDSSFEFVEGGKVILSNNRAEPTTEFVEDKKVTDVQPFTSKDGRYTIVHNGTIANDKLLKKKFKYKLDTEIDSAVIPEVLSDLWIELDGETNRMQSLQRVFNRFLRGSFALGIYDSNFASTMYLTTNYKPIFMERRGSVVYFSSLKEFFDVKKLDGLIRNIDSVPAYSIVKISEEGVFTRSLREERSTKGRALVVCSGGLDSTVVAKKMLEDGYDVTLLHFKYKCRAEDKEIQAVKDIAEELKVEALFVEIDVFKNVIKHSPLVEEGSEIAKGDKGVEFAYEWVPARNLIMLSIATGIAEGHGYDVIALGNNLEEAGAYPDNEEIFIQKFSEILPYAVNVDKQVEIVMPVGNLMKHEIVKLGIQIKAPLGKTWSCYEAGEQHCGECGPCRMRRVGFDMNGKKDIISYEN